MTLPRRLHVEDRELGILKFLRSLEEPNRGATVREIWESVGTGLGDNVTQQAYYKLIDRLVAVGKLDPIDDAGVDGGQRYAVAPHLHAESALSLDDVYELLDSLAPSEATARVLEARDYFEERRQGTLKRAAEALLEEDPLELFHAMLVHKFKALGADEQLFRDSELKDRGIEARVDSQTRELGYLAYRMLGLSREAIDVPGLDELNTGDRVLSLDPDKLRNELRMRVFGDRFIMSVNVSSERGSDFAARMTVAGSDGSTHASVAQPTTGSAFADDVGQQIVTFNNSVVYVELAPVLKGSIEFPYYSVPMTRSAIDDPSNRGMVLAPFMYRYLSESEYEHMAKCATDVVQWRADETVFAGTARALRDGALLPRPLVQFRDGTLTPQEREWGHYKRRNEYGEMVREGIAHGRKILEKIAGNPNPSVFAGAVKATQVRLFSTILNWYIAQGSTKRFGQPIEPQWDVTRAAHIPDAEAMTVLLSSLENRRQDGSYYVTCAVMRPFHTLTEFFKVVTNASHNWVQWFERLRSNELQHFRAGMDSEMPYLASVPDLSDENFVFMCAKADYVAFYMGHTAGDPPPLAPRYEFLESLRTMGGGAGDAAQRVSRNVRFIVAALDRTGFAADKEHNYLSKKLLVKLVPYVLFEAHEKCKALGRQLEAELRSVVVARLKELKSARVARISDIEFVPLSIRKFLERYSRTLDADRRRDPDKFER